MKMRIPKYQFFSNDEYKRRVSALRSRMQQKQVDVMLVTTPENLYYLSGYQTPGYYWFQTLIVPMDQEPLFITRLSESSNIEPLTWVEDSRPYEDTDDWLARTKDALIDLGLDGKSIGLENNSWFFPYSDHVRLRAMLSSATFVDCSGLVEQGRVIKSPKELEYIRHAAKAAEAGLLAGIEAADVGVTENEVAAEIHRAQILAGSEYTGIPIFIRSGPRDAMTHATWYRKRLEPNESVTFEIPGCINRYHAALYRQVFLGDPPDILLRGMEVAIDTLQKAKSAIKPGVKAGEVVKVVQDSLIEGVGVGLPSRVAYSIGIAFAPDWGEGHIMSLFKGDERLLRAGMTFHLTAGRARIPALASTAGRAVCTDSILVTEDGCETLTNALERKLYVK